MLALAPGPMTGLREAVVAPTLSSNRQRGGAAMWNFAGLLKTSAGHEPHAVRGHIQYSPESAERKYGGWFRLDGLRLRGSRSDVEYQLDIQDGPCLRIRIGEVDGGTAEFESVGDPLPRPPAP